ncbi:MAG: glycosyltransferase family 2 protein [Gammaproteobacteria bacterium]|nr:glycosyltransferase family 2 protein [Gammaproteobacteria bacterium]
MGRDVVAVIVNFNSGPLLKEAVDSLLAGTIRPEIEVVDNASTDHSADFLNTDPGYRESVRLTMNDRNLGFSRANNQVLRGGSARYYLLMNPDCVLEPNALAELVAYMDSNTDVGLAGGALMNRDGTLQKTSKRKFPTPWSALARTLGLHRLDASDGALGDFDLARNQTCDGGPETVEAVSGALMFVRGSALDKVGLLDEGFFMHCEDLDWCMRFRDAGYGVAYVPSAGAVHVKGGSGRGPGVVWHLHRGMIRFYGKHYRNRYPPYFTWLVYAAVYARCGILMALSLVRRRS